MAVKDSTEFPLNNSFGPDYRSESKISSETWFEVSIGKAAARNGGHCRPNAFRDVPMDQAQADSTFAASYQEFTDVGPVDGVVERTLNPEQAKKATCCPSARAAYGSPAGSLWPNKLDIHLLKLWDAGKKR
ncbi:hypothetical protein DFH07DRAFT_764697 [Mycena maculata]|uniref:Uncharacterized protein n=1 Tax=Mycena maculata TaxID=230809 RepID=A0AAD7KCL3_9AGAR|nr:hypothetical protein DFH07DRAFT_764697 [Mycena maculata]